MGVIETDFRAVIEFLVVCQHDNKGNVKYFLEVSSLGLASKLTHYIILLMELYEFDLLCELEWYGMSNVHAIAARSSACIKIKWNAFLIFV